MHLGCSSESKQEKILKKKFGCCHFGNLKVSAAKASQDFDVRRFPEFFSFLSTRFIIAKEEDYAHRL